MKRKFYNYLQWEEYKQGMWRKVDVKQEQQYLDKAIAFTGDHMLYGHWMKQVITQWPISCEQNLSNAEINHKAWIGHAACCIAFNCPEYIVRMAWHHLTPKQQDLANEQAEIAYKIWVGQQTKNYQLNIFEEQG